MYINPDEKARTNDGGINNKLYVKTSTSHVTISDIYKFGSLTKTKVNEFFP